MEAGRRMTMCVKTNRFWLFWALLFECLARWCDDRAVKLTTHKGRSVGKSSVVDEETFEEPFFG
jgi:creatinine amidohydrolase/Fe(II)-dependent formamide hydrolase-like protein